MNGPGIAPGIYPSVPMHQYLRLPGVSSTHLGWLARSPLHYKHFLRHPPAETEPMMKGTALHYSLLEPEAFGREFVVEPDLSTFSTTPRPRATKTYRDWRATQEAQGMTVLRVDEVFAIGEMVKSVQAHPVAARLIGENAAREQTLLWEEVDGRLCRGRVDLIAEQWIADVKTTRSLARFNPWVISDQGYYRQLAWYARGLKWLGREITHAYIIAIENTEPYDVGVFMLDPGALTAGAEMCERLLTRLAECELTDQWPGMFPTLQQGMIVDSLMADIGESEI